MKCAEAALYSEEVSFPKGLNTSKRTGSIIKSANTALITEKLISTPRFCVGWKLEKRKIQNPAVRTIDVIRIGFPVDLSVFSIAFE